MMVWRRVAESPLLEPAPPPLGLPLHHWFLPRLVLSSPVSRRQPRGVVGGEGLVAGARSVVIVMWFLPHWLRIWMVNLKILFLCLRAVTMNPS